MRSAAPKPSMYGPSCTSLTSWIGPTTCPSASTTDARRSSLSLMSGPRDPSDDVIPHPALRRDRADLLGVERDRHVRADVRHPFDRDATRVTALEPAVGPPQPAAQPARSDAREPR